MERLKAAAAKAGAALKPVAANPLDEAWGAARPAQPTAPVVPHTLEHAGEESSAKRNRIGQVLAGKNADATVLTTFVVLPDRGEIYERSLEFNMMLLDIARDEQIPLINLWAAAQTLPDDGIGPDHTHLKAQVGSLCSFDGAQQQFGGTLRNLLTLQALDQLRQNVLSR